MSRSRNLAPFSLALSTALILIAGPALSQPLGLGREALPEEVDAWDVAVLPDGTGLRPGSGSVEDGDEIFYEQCASCHGDFAEGRDSWPALSGGMGTLTDPRPVKTIGSYWPHLSTVHDYIHRSMPFGGAQTLTQDETYAITAFLLYSNGMVEDDFVLTHENFTEIVMPNAEGFYPDDRPETEYPIFSAEPCMQDCRDTAPEVTRRAVDLGVTPMGEDGRPAGTLPATFEVAQAPEAVEEPEEAPEVTAGEIAPEAAETEEAAAEPTEEATPDTAAEAEALDPSLVAEGERAFRKCSACHQVGDGARNGAGPHLNGVFGAIVGHVEDFRYSNVFQQMHEDGTVWDHDSLSAFLENPRGFAQGTRMSFAGIRNQDERDAIIAYLRSLEP